ncbi:MAG: ATP-binding protein [Ignavibacteriales bacterium]|nr:ATP-binding protein [Ignavibacteriales bacterium]
MNSLKHNPAYVLMGPRQSGKTTIAREIEKHFKNSIYLDMEDSRDVRKLEDPLAHFARFSDSLIIIDEIQTKPDLFRELRPAIDARGKNGCFLLLGSASPVLVQGVSEYLTGRVDYIEITPFTMEELPKEKSRDRHLIRGGFPRSFLAANDALSMNWRKSYIQSYSFMELVSIFGTGFNKTTVANLWRMLAHSQGGLLNQAVLSTSLGVSAPTVKRYIDYLDASFHLRLLQPWHINVKKRIVKSPKVYIRDSGLLLALLDIGNINELLGHPIVGQLWEGYVIEQIASGLKQDFTLYFYRTSHGAEADIVIAKGLEPVILAEIKFSNSPVPSRGFYETITDLNPVKTYVISPEGSGYPGKNGVFFCGIDLFIDEISKICS